MATQTVLLTPLEQETRSGLPTKEAAGHLNRAEQTLRQWACKQTYPRGLEPRLINGRLHWPVDGLRAVLGVAG